MAGFVEFVQQVVKRFKDFRDSGEEGVSQLPTKVEPVYTSFKNSVTAVDDAYKLSRASDFTQKIADEDDRRDNLYKQLVSLLKMFRKFGYDAEKKEAGDYVWNIVKKYNVDVNENYSEESGKLQQMLQELEENSQAVQHTATLGIDSLITQLKAANEQVRTLMNSRNDERMQVEKAALAKARTQADQAYCDLILSLNAAAVMDDDAHRFDELISQVNELIKYFRQYVVPKGGKKDKDTEEQDNGGDNGNGGNSNGGGESNSGGESQGGNNTKGSGNTNGSDNQGGESQGGDNGSGGESQGGDNGSGGESQGGDNGNSGGDNSFGDFD
jgi:hypothetical protein